MRAIQLELFPAATKKMAAASPEASGTQPDVPDTTFLISVNLYDTDGRVCARETIDVTMTLDPCRSCPLREVCCEDECGQKLYDIDTPEEDLTPFKDWLSDTLY